MSAQTAGAPAPDEERADHAAVRGPGLDDVSAAAALTRMPVAPPAQPDTPPERMPPQPPPLAVAPPVASPHVMPPRPVPKEFGRGETVDKLWLRAASLRGPASVVAVSSADGGVGRSTFAAAVGALLAFAVPRPVVAVDASGDAFGGMGYRAAERRHLSTVWDATQAATAGSPGHRDSAFPIDSLCQVGPTGLRVLVGESQLSAERRPPTMPELMRVVSCVRMLAGLVIVDLPPAVTWPAWNAFVTATAPVLVARASVDGVQHAMRLLAQLRAAGLGEVAAKTTVVVVEISPATPKSVLAAERQAAGQARGLVRVPHDPVLARPAPLDPRALRRHTREALLWAASSAVQLCPADPDAAARLAEPTSSNRRVKEATR